MAEIGYVTVAAADTYVAEHFTSKDPLRLAWEALGEADREVLLRRSFESIESLPYAGRKTDPSQPNAFPRWPSREVPPVVIAAQVENAISLNDSSATEDAAYYERLWQFGVESYSIGNLSESIGSGAWSGISAASSGIVSAKAIRLLKPLLGGGYSIRGGRGR